jgi:hypothetical protein
MTEIDVTSPGPDSNSHLIGAVPLEISSDGSKMSGPLPQFLMSLIDQMAETSAHFSSLGAVGLCGAFV